MKLRFFFYIIFVLIFSTGFSQERTQDSTKVSLLDEVPISTLIYKNVTGLTNSTLIKSRVLETFSPIEMTNSINQVPGVYALSGAINTNRITIRGIGSRTPYGTDKLRLYYNNIPITNGVGSSTIEAYDIENLGSIEVIKGPKGTAYGANLGGAILLNSKVAEENGITLTNNFTIGSYGMLKDHVNFTHTSGKLSLGLRYNHTEIEGYRQNNRYARDGILLNTDYKINKKHAVGLLVNYIDYFAQIASSISQTAFDEDTTQAAGNWLAAKGYEDNASALVGFYYKGNIAKNLENTTAVFYNNIETYEARPFNILDENTLGFGFKTEFNGSLKINNRPAKYTLGAELYKDEYEWETYENLYRDNNGNGSLEGNQLSMNKEFRNQFNISSSFLLPLTNKFSAQFNLAFNKTSYNFRDLYNTGANNRSANRSFDAILLPSFTLDYTFNPSYNLYFNFSKGFSNPSLEETLTPDGVINPDIAQEIGFNYEVGTSLKLLDRKLNIDLAIYQMDISDLLVAERVDEDQYIGRNAGRTKHKGIELDLNYKIPFINSSFIQPYFKYTLNDHSFVDFIDEDEDFSGNDLTGVPKNKVDAGFYWLLNGFYLNTTYQFVDEIPLTDANTLNSDSFSLFNTKLGYETTIKEKFIVSLNAGVNNIFDKKYAQSVLINAVGFGGAEPRYFYPGNNRNYYGSIKIKYQLNATKTNQPDKALFTEEF